MIKSMLFTLIPALLLGSLLPLQAEAKESAYPASFQINGEPTSTVAEFTQRLRDLYPSITTYESKVENVVFRGHEYPAMAFKTVGLLSDSKVEQTLTYIQLHAGLWRMVYVEGRTCIQGVAVEDGEWVRGWKCRTIENPISGAFSDIYLISNLEVDLAALSAEWGKKVEVRKEGAPQEGAEAPKEKLLTLSDIKETILKFGGTWREENVTWTNYSATVSGPALKIHVKTTLGKFKVSQSFLYLLDGNLLLLKEIDGIFCHYVERVDKEICDTNHGAAYVQTRVTPFPIKLRREGV